MLVLSAALPRSRQAGSFQQSGPATFAAGRNAGGKSSPRLSGQAGWNVCRQVCKNAASTRSPIQVWRICARSSRPACRSVGCSWIARYYCLASEHRDHQGYPGCAAGVVVQTRFQQPHVDPVDGCEQRQHNQRQLDLMGVPDGGHVLSLGRSGVRPFPGYICLACLHGRILTDGSTLRRASTDPSGAEPANKRRCIECRSPTRRRWNRAAVSGTRR